MKKQLLLLQWAVLLCTVLQSQTTYTFTGTGNWNNSANPANWSPSIPPNPLPLGHTIIIAGSCTMIANRNIQGTLIVNAGATLTLNAGNTLNINNIMQNNGNVLINGTLNNNMQLHNNNGTVITIAMNGVLSNGNSGTFTNHSGATVHNNDNGTFRNRNITYNHGVFNHQGRLFTNGNSAGDHFINSGTLNNYASILNQHIFTNTLTGAVTNHTNISVFSNNGQLLNNNTFSNHGTILIGSGATWTNAAGSSLTNMSGATFTNNNILNNQGLFFNQGTINTGNSGGDALNNSSTLTNEGTLTINNGALNNNSGAHLVNNNILNNYNTLNNQGTLSVCATCILNNGNSSGDRLHNTGILNLQGTLVNFTVNNLDNFTGTIAGSGGSIQGNFNNTGTLTLVNGSISSFPITGSFTNTSSGTIILEIDATPAADQIVTPSAVLGGTLELVLIGPGAIAVGSSFTLVTNASGNFNTRILPGDPSNWSMSSTPLVYESGAPLPIELLYFEGKVGNDAIDLYWRTATERNNDFMEVQRSTDGKRFEPLGRVWGQGTTITPQDYRFTDTSPLLGVNYYRLRQVDFDGKEEYHRVIAVLFRVDKRAGAVQVFPTLAQEQLTIILPEPAETVVAVFVSDMNGRIVSQHTLGRGTQQYQLPVAQLTAGHYVVMTKQNNQLQLARFVKQ